MSTIRPESYIDPLSYAEARELTTPATKPGPIKANDTQVGGAHYKVLDPRAQEHWDIVRFHKLDYFQAAITKYVMRHKNKNGLEDLKKARHFLDKYIEIVEEAAATCNGDPTSGYVNQDR